MDHFSIVVALLGGLCVALGLVSKRLEQSPLPLTLLALLFGIAVGPVGLGFLDIEAIGDRTAVVEAVARLTLAIGLVGVALRVPKAYPRRSARELLVLVGLGMPLMWLAGTALLVLVLGLPLLVAALLGAAVTATDPIAASPIVTGPVARRNLPESVRHALSVESGANDGLSYLFVFLPLLLLTRAPGEAWQHWLVHTLLWEVLAATAFGFAIGYAGARLLRGAEARGLIEEDWRLVFTVALSLLAVGAGRLAGSDELLVVFAAGMAFVQVIDEHDRAEEERGQEAVNRFFSIPFFALLGALIPWSEWYALGAAGVLIAVTLPVLRRLPALLLLRPLLGSVGRTRDALFMGWFGPIAVAAVYYAALIETHLEGHAEAALVWPVVTLLACASVVLHGVSATPLTRLYGAAAGRTGTAPAAPSSPRPARAEPAA